MQQSASALQLWGAGGFGFLIGWSLYYVNRHRGDAVRGYRDLATLIAAIGGGAVLALFPAGTDLFGAYGLGLVAGFLVYFGVLGLLVWRSSQFDLDYFIDGRHKEPPPGTVVDHRGGALGPQHDVRIPE